MTSVDAPKTGPEKGVTFFMPMLLDEQGSQKVETRARNLSKFAKIQLIPP